MEKYFDVMKALELANRPQPSSERLKAVLLDWEDVVNQAYANGYEAGRKAATTND